MDRICISGYIIRMMRQRPAKRSLLLVGQLSDLPSRERGAAISHAADALVPAGL
jgi:hypothetical protein